MNTHALAAEIVTKVRNSMQDSATNQCAAVERMIREAINAELLRPVESLTPEHPLPHYPPTALPQPEWPPSYPTTFSLTFNNPLE